MLTIRTLLGLLFVFSGISGLMSGSNVPEGTPETMVAATQTLWDTGILQMVKVTELIAGLMLLFGFLPALAAIFLAPVGVGIVIVNARLAPAYLPIGIVLCVLIGYLGYVYWDQYKVLFRRK